MDSLEMSPDGWAGSPSSDNDLSEQYFDVNYEFSDVDEDEEVEEWEGFDDDGPGTPATSMPPPPETVYPDVDTAKKSIQSWARMHGYAIRTQRSKARKNGDISKVFLQHHDESTRQRHLTGSCKTNCPFSVVVTESNGTWVVNVRDINRRDHIQRGGVKAGIRARETVRTLRQLDPSTSVTRRDIHNLRADIKRKELAGLSPIQALLFQLDEDSDYISFNKRDENQRVIRLLFMHKSSIEMLRWHSQVLIMDSTYKTNWFRLPLFNIVGMTSTNRTFTVGREDSILWVFEHLGGIYGRLSLLPPVTIKAIRSFYPFTNHLLCLWHITKNIFRAEALVVTEHFLKFWYPFVNAQRRESFNQAWTELRNRYESKPQFMDYLSDELLPKKEKVVRYWTNNALHFGTIVTSRGEALHHSVGDLKDVVDTFSLIFKDQQHEYSVEVERAKNTRQHRHSRQLFAAYKLRLH
ncbi:hypothetical protein V1506DRAFT_545859 [Lipomyces tetrasporus]